MNKIFRTLLMTIALVMGVVNVQAEEESIWTESSKYFTISADVFKKANTKLKDGTILRIYTTGQTSAQYGTFGTTIWQSQMSWGSNGYLLTDDATLYDSNRGCFTLVMTADQATNILQYGISFNNAQDIRVTLEAGEGTGTGDDTPVTPVTTTHKLTYIVDGNTYKSYDVESGASITPEVNPLTVGYYKPGYKFEGWKDLPSTMPDNDVTTEAVFSVNKYIISYYINYQEGDEPYTTVEVDYGSTIVPITPSIEGYRFVRWDYCPETMPAQNIDVKGTAIQVYTLTLNYNNTEGNVTASKVEDIAKEESAIVTVSPAEGYEVASVVFANADGSTPNKWFQDGLYYVQFGESNVTCTVTFRQAEVVTYEVWNGTITGGNVTATPSTAAAGEEITLTLAPQSGYVLETISVTDGTNNIELSEDYKFTMPASNVTVNATFVDPASLLPKHTLTINIDGVQTTKEVAEETDLSIVLPTPTKNGYSFAGWTGMPEDGKMPTSDLELTAQFTEATYTLTFMLDNAVFGTPQQKKYGEAITTPTGIPVEDGYTFGGWQNVPATMPAQDLVIYGFHVKDSETVKLSVGSSGYSTYYGDKALYFNGTEAVKAYVAYAIGTSVVSLKQVIGSVAANTAMVLKGDAANASATIAVVGTGETKTNNLLRGVTVDTSINDFRKYVLVEKNAEDGTKVVKFADTGNHAATVPANKAYLQAPAGANARQLTIIFEGGVTAIEAISTENDDVPAVFNLSGQQVKNPGKGLYIINGKKVIIK